MSQLKEKTVRISVGCRNCRKRQMLWTAYGSENPRGFRNAETAERNLIAGLCNLRWKQDDDKWLCPICQSHYEEEEVKSNE